VAGIIGRNEAAGTTNITNSYSTIDLAATTTNNGVFAMIGGLVGDANGTTFVINNSYYYGSIETFNAAQTAPSHNGGLVGRVSTPPVINNSFAYMTAQTNQNNLNTETGGLVGSAIMLADGNNTYYSPNINTSTGNPSSTNIVK